MEARAMDLTALLLSRLQFAFKVSFHIGFPSFSIGLAAWLVVLEGRHLATGRPVYRRLFDFWLKIFGLGVVSGQQFSFCRTADLLTSSAARNAVFDTS
jgi:cytochrome bd ubiquinol oxidase subunit I